MSFKRKDSVIIFIAFVMLKAFCFEQPCNRKLEKKAMLEITGIAFYRHGEQVFQKLIAVYFISMIEGS
jgi:hypothetical protein